MTVNLPFYIKAKILSECVSDVEGAAFDCYIFAVTAIRNRPLLFTVHTEHGAVFSRLPIESFGPETQEWSCMGDDIQAIQLDYLKDYEVKFLSDGKRYRYLMSFDTFNGGFAQDPEQHKMLHLFTNVEGSLFLRTNNEVLFLDKHFVDNTDLTKHYKRNSTYHLSES